MSRGKSLALATAVSFSPSGAARRYRSSTAANRSGVSGKSSWRYLRANIEAGPLDRHDEVRLRAIGEGGSDEVDDRPFRRTHRPYRAHDDLHEVHRLFGALVQFDMKIRGEVVDHDVAAVDRLQHQDLFLDRLSGPVRCRPEHAGPVSTTQGNLRPAPVLHRKRSMGPIKCLLCARIYTSCVERMKLLAAALMLFCMAASTAAQSMGGVVGSIVDQTGAPLPGVRMTIRGVADPRRRTPAPQATSRFRTSRKVTTKFPQS